MAERNSETEAKQLFITTYALPMLRKCSAILEGGLSESEEKAANSVAAAISGLSKWLNEVTDTPLIVPDDILDRLQAVVVDLETKPKPKKR